MSVVPPVFSLSRGPRGRSMDNLKTVDVDPDWYPGQPELAELGQDNVPTVLSKLQKWADYPSVGQPVEPTKFLPMKTPLSTEILANWSLPTPPKHTLALPQLFAGQAEAGRTIGMILDLSNHDCLYSEDIPSGVVYHHIQLIAKELPSREFVSAVRVAANTFWAQHPDRYIAIHCAYGFNRTGFVVCSYLIEQCHLSVAQSLAAFATSRPPGVRHEKFRDELYRRYSSPSCPASPSRLPAMAAAPSSPTVGSPQDGHGRGQGQDDPACLTRPDDANSSLGCSPFTSGAQVLPNDADHWQPVTESSPGACLVGAANVVAACLASGAATAAAAVAAVAAAPAECLRELSFALPVADQAVSPSFMGTDTTVGNGQRHFVQCDGASAVGQPIKGVKGNDRCVGIGSGMTGGTAAAGIRGAGEQNAVGSAGACGTSGAGGTIEVVVLADGLAKTSAAEQDVDDNDSMGMDERIVLATLSLEATQGRAGGVGRSGTSSPFAPLSPRTQKRRSVTEIEWDAPPATAPPPRPPLVPPVLQP